MGNYPVAYQIENHFICRNCLKEQKKSMQNIEPLLNETYTPVFSKDVFNSRHACHVCGIEIEVKVSGESISAKNFRSFISKWEEVELTSPSVAPVRFLEEPPKGEPFERPEWQERTAGFQKTLLEDMQGVIYRWSLDQDLYAEINWFLKKGAEDKVSTRIQTAATLLSRARKVLEEALPTGYHLQTPDSNYGYRCERT